MNFAYQTATMPTTRRRAFVQIYIGSQDVTSALEPHLISVEVLLRSFGVNTANIELDDRDASLPIPPDRMVVKILMGWSGQGPILPLAEHVERKYGLIIPDKYPNGLPIDELPYQTSGAQMVFMGLITNVESGFSRNGGGRRLWIECKGHLDKDAGKTPMNMSMGEGDPDSGQGQQIPLQDFLSKAGSNAGYSVSASGIMGISRNFWGQSGQSFLSMLDELSKNFGIDYEVVGNTAYVFPPGMSPNGEAQPTVEATWGINLISWRIKPYVGRPQWKESQAHFFDIWNGMWKNISKSIAGKTPFGNVDAIAGLPAAAPNSQAGDQTNEGSSQAAQRDRGTGWTIINGEPLARPRGNIIITGARPGVDGRYRIKEAEHNYTRGGGYTTRCQVEHPQLIDSDFKEWGDYEAMGAHEIEKQLQEHPFFMWQEGVQPPTT